MAWVQGCCASASHSGMALDLHDHGDRGLVNLRCADAFATKERAYEVVGEQRGGQSSACSFPWFEPSGKCLGKMEKGVKKQ